MPHRPGNQVTLVKMIPLPHLFNHPDLFLQPTPHFWVFRSFKSSPKGRSKCPEICVPPKRETVAPTLIYIRVDRLQGLLQNFRRKAPAQVRRIAPLLGVPALPETAPLMVLTMSASL